MTSPSRHLRGTARVLAAALAVTSLAACEDEIPAPAALPERSKPVELDLGGAAEDAQTAPYAYTPTGKRDPFSTPFKKVAPGGGGPVGPIEAGRKLKPLQKWEIDQLKLAFTTTGTSTPMALVLDPTGTGHTVHIGDFVGKNWGTVHSIGREEIRVLEKMRDDEGRIFPQWIVMKMPKTEAELRAEQALAPEEN